MTTTNEEETPLVAWIKAGGKVIILTGYTNRVYVQAEVDHLTPKGRIVLKGRGKEVFRPDGHPLLRDYMGRKLVPLTDERKEAYRKQMYRDIVQDIETSKLSPAQIKEIAFIVDPTLKGNEDE